MNKVHFSSASDNWSTPQNLFDQLNDKYGPFELDVCASKTNAKCHLFFTVEGKYQTYEKEFEKLVDGDGLSSPWRFEGCPLKCWMNPPYGRTIGLWVKKAYEESQKGCLVVCLLPARTDTKWFHEYCTKGDIEFIKGRLKFGEAKNSAPFPSMVIVFRPKGS